GSTSPPSLQRNHTMIGFQQWTSALGIVFALALVPARADEPATGFLNRVYKGADGVEARYVLFVPQDYRGQKPYPLILFLHGAGEWGSDGQKQVTVGLGPAVKKRAS